MEKPIVKIQELQTATIIKIALTTGENIEVRVPNTGQHIAVNTSDMGKQLLLETTISDRIIIKPTNRL